MSQFRSPQMFGTNDARYARMTSARRERRFAGSPLRGFTLVELMIAVAMVGVLAALAIVGYRRYMEYSKSGDATAVLSADFRTQGVRKSAAELLGITFRSMRYRLAKLGMEVSRGNDEED